MVSTEPSWERALGLAEVLRSALVGGTDRRRHHALLIVGPKGSGRGMLAEWLAQAEFCTSRTAEGLPCGACTDCTLVRDGGHPDVHWLGTTGRVGIGDVRGLIETSGIRPTSGLAVFVLEGAGTVTGYAAAAMLKTLEEPHGNRLFLLLADSSDQVDPTLRSRCQIVRIPPRSEDELATWLIREQGVERQKAEQVARRAGGWPGRALDLLQQTDAEPASGLDRESVLAIFAGQEPGRILEVARQIAERKADVLSLSVALRDLWLQGLGALEAAGGALSPLTHDDRMRIAAEWPLPQLRQASVFVAAAAEAQSWNCNAELNWDVLLLRLQQLKTSHRHEVS